jgi:hypothetical protein
MMDWPVIGTVSATILVAGALTFEVVVFMQPDPAPTTPLPQLARLIGPERIVLSESLVSPLTTPIEPARIPQHASPPPRLARLIEPDRTLQGESPMPADPEPAAPRPQTASIASALAKSSPSGVVYTAPPPREFKTAKLTLAEPTPPPRAEQWRVIVTAGATYYNLGGHVDRAGIVDELASSHLRDALKAHRNFPRLPPELRTHILTQNISLPRLAPYRGLLGMNDRTLEEEQAIKFVRVVSNR